MSAPEIIQQVLKPIEAFLEQNEYRRASERFAIRNEYDGYEGHFDIDPRSEHKTAHQHSVNRTKLCTTMDLHMDCKLCCFYPFGNEASQHEKMALHRAKRHRDRSRHRIGSGLLHPLYSTHQSDVGGALWHRTLTLHMPARKREP